MNTARLPSYLLSTAGARALHSAAESAARVPLNAVIEPELPRQVDSGCVALEPGIIKVWVYIYIYTLLC